MEFGDLTFDQKLEIISKMVAGDELAIFNPDTGIIHSCDDIFSVVENGDVQITLRSQAEYRLTQKDGTEVVIETKGSDDFPAITV